VVECPEIHSGHLLESENEYLAKRTRRSSADQPVETHDLTDHDAGSPEITGASRDSTSTVASAPPPVESGDGKTSDTPSAAGWRKTFSSLSSRNYLLLWAGMIGVMAGMQMQMLARSYLVYDITGSASLLGIVSAGSAVPMLVFSMFGGAFADRLDKRRIIQIAQAVFALLALGVGLMIFFDRISWVYLMIAAVVQGTAFSFMMPARQAIIPSLVSRDQLTNAMALSSAGMSAMTLAAPAFAGFLYAFAGPDIVYFVISGLGFMAVVITSFLPRTDAGPSRRRGPILRDIGDGLSYLKRNRLIMTLLVMGLATSVLAMPFRMLMPLFVVDVYELGPESMGLLVAAMGGASLFGALFVASLSDWRRGMLLLFGSFMSGIALLLLAAIPIYLAAIFFMIPLGLGDAARRTLNQSLVLERTDDEYRGRVMGIFMMNRGMMPLGVLPTALLASVLGARFAIGLLAVLLLLFTTFILVTQKRVRELS
jgi:MFS family permease